MRCLSKTSLISLALCFVLSAFGAAPDASNPIRTQRLKDAEHNFTKKKYDDAASGFEYALAIDAEHPDNPRVEERLIESLMRSGREDKAVRRVSELENLYNKESVWGSANKVKNNEELKKHFQGVVAAGRRISEEMTGGKGEKQKSRRLELLDHLYGALRNLAIQPEDRTFFAERRAEVLAGRGKPVEASELLVQAAKEMKKDEKKQEALELAAVDVLRRAARVDALAARKLPLLTYAERTDAPLEAVSSPLTEIESLFIKRAEDFASDHSDHSRADRLMYEQAALLYSKAQFEPSEEITNKLLKREPEPTVFDHAVRLRVNLLDQSSQYADLVKFCKETLKEKRLPEATRGPLAETLRVAEFSRVAQLERDKHFEEAAKGYLEYVQVYGQQDMRASEDALNSAAMCFSRINNVAEAAKARERFLKLFPESPRYQATLEILMDQLAMLGDFAKASERLAEHAQRFPKSKRAQNSFWWSALYAAAGGDLGTAEKRLMEYERRYPSEARNAQEERASLYRGTGQLDKRIALMDLEAKHSPLAQSLQIERQIHYLQKGEAGASQPTWIEKRAELIEKKSKELRTTRAGRELIAEAALYRARPSESAVYRTARAPEKLKKFATFETQMKAIAVMDAGEWHLAALAKLAMGYQHLVDSLTNESVAGKGTSAAEQHYAEATRRQTLLEPNENKALEAAEKCVLDAYDQNLRSPWIAECYRLASARDSEKYPLVRSAYLPPFIMTTAPTKHKLQTIGALQIPVGSFSGLALGRIHPRVDNGVAAASNWAVSRHRELANATLEPARVDYTTVRKEYERRLSRISRDEATGDEENTLSYLHALRVVKPEAAVKAVLAELQNSPRDIALHIVLADTQLELGRPYEASVMLRSAQRWAALDDERAALLNQLGVAEIVAGNEERAIYYFGKSASPEAAANLGWMAARYRNAGEAFRQFELAAGVQPENRLFLLGLAVAQIQNGTLRAADETLKKIGGDIEEDPVGRLIRSYVKADLQGDVDSAQRDVSSWIEAHNTDEAQGGPFSALLRSLEVKKRNRQFFSPTRSEVQ